MSGWVECLSNSRSSSSRWPASTPDATCGLVETTGRAARAHATVTDPMQDLGRSVQKGLVWSFANTIILRLGSLIVGWCWPGY